MVETTVTRLARSERGTLLIAVLDRMRDPRVPKQVFDRGFAFARELAVSPVQPLTDHERRTWEESRYFRRD